MNSMQTTQHECMLESSRGTIRLKRRVSLATVCSLLLVLMPGTVSARASGKSVGVWLSTSSLAVAREFFTATPLQDGRVLAAGGTDDAFHPFDSAEVYNAQSGVWSSTGSLTTARWSHTATLLPDGRVLVAGGAAAFD